MNNLECFVLILTILSYTTLPLVNSEDVFYYIIITNNIESRLSIKCTNGRTRIGTGAIARSKSYRIKTRTATNPHRNIVCRLERLDLNMLPQNLRFWAFSEDQNFTRNCDNQNNVCQWTVNEDGIAMKDYLCTLNCRHRFVPWTVENITDVN